MNYKISESDNQKILNKNIAQYHHFKEKGYLDE